MKMYSEFNEIAKITKKGCGKHSENELIIK